MRVPMSLRRLPRFALVIAVVAVAAIAVAAAIAGNRSTDLDFTPQKADQVTNIDVLRQQLKNYYGAPTAKTGISGTWQDPLNLDSNYANEARGVAKDGGNWLAARANKKDAGKRAIVLDVDDTTLTTWNYELYSNWDFNPATNGDFVNQELFPATPGMVEMVNQAAAEGYAVFFLTGRPVAQYDATLGNLTDSDTTGVNAGYTTPTLIDLDGSGPGGEAPGLFTKPPVGSYPDYLDQPQFCGPAVDAGASCPTIQYKSGTRAYIESLGYDIVGNFGDQFSDLEGGFADKTFKMPNPNYFLP